jgi:hypothetical protein
MEWWYSHLTPAISRGYAPLIETCPPPVWVVPPPPGELGLLAFCPTVVGVDNESPQAETVHEILAQLTGGDGGLPDSLLVVGMQHGPGGETEAVRRLRSFGQSAQRRRQAFAAFRMVGFGKVKSLNVALRLARERAIPAVLQVDDDVRLDQQCLTRLYRAFAAGGSRGAVGAAKTGLSRSNAASRLLRWLKNQTRPACNYPHACCIIIDPGCLPHGIPPRFVSDDGYICFSLLRPGSDDPWELLRLVPDARCFHFVGGQGGRSMRRIRRLLLNHHVNMVSFPASVGRFYFGQILFPGFRPLGSAARRSQPLAWCLQLLYFCLFMGAAAELILRGLVRRPLKRIAWAGYDDRARPPVPSLIPTPEANP